MKKLFLFFATAIFCLASCNNAEFDNSVTDLGGNSSVSPSGEDVYTIEIEGCDPATKGNAVSQSMGYASLSGTDREAKPTAHLKKNGKEVSASYTWSIKSGYEDYFELDKNNSQQCLLTGKKIKSSTTMLSVLGTDGVGSKSIDVPVEVYDNLTIGWVDKSMTLTSGVEQPCTVQTNHAGASVTFTCPSGCKIGESSASGTSNVTLKTGDDGKATVYVMYTGTSNTTLSLKATASTATGSQIIE